MDSQEQEKKPQEIPLDITVARTLGNGLKQIFPVDSLNKILQESAFAGNKLPKYKTRFEKIDLSIRRIIALLEKLQTSKEVKLVYENLVWDFKFSEEILPTQPLSQGEITLDDILSKRLKSALDHNLKNFLVPVIGYAEFIGDSATDADIKKSLQFIDTSGKAMNEEVSLVTKGRIKLSTDNQGVTKIFSVPDR